MYISVQILTHGPPCTCRLSNTVLAHGPYLIEYDFSFAFFCFSFGAKHATPRSLSARNLGNLVCVEGIVTKCKHLVSLVLLLVDIIIDNRLVLGSTYLYIQSHTVLIVYTVLLLVTDSRVGEGDYVPPCFDVEGTMPPGQKSCILVTLMLHHAGLLS